MLTYYKSGNHAEILSLRFPPFISLPFTLVWFIRQYADGLVELSNDLVEAWV